jgi:sugar lactone lactonase YvrE
MQAWFFFAVASAFLIAQKTRIRKSLFVSPASRKFGGAARYIWTLVFILLFAGSLIFTVMGPIGRHRHDEYQRVKLPLTLDGQAYMKHGPLENEYRAIKWLNENVKDSPALLEASGADYLYDYGRISANTGLPSILGWWSHVDQREYKRDTGRMKIDIKEIYESLDVPKVLNLLLKYQVRYIYVGRTEKKDYSASGLKKFAEMTDYMTPIYANPDVTIYQINDYGLNVSFAQVASDSNAMADLQARLQEDKAKAEEEQTQKENARKEALRRQPPKAMFQGGEGESKGQFSEPRSCAVDPEGNVYVADFRNHRIQKFDSTGNWLAMWGTSGEGPGEFNDICAIAADQNGIYVADTFNNRIQKFDPNGNFLAQWNNGNGPFYYPRGIACDGKGFIYIADTGHHRIVKLKNTGEFITAWGVSGSKQGEFSDPIGICAISEKVYVADKGNHRVQIFDKDGAFLNAFPILGWEGEVFVEPYLVVDQNGSIWVSDPTANRIFVFDGSGKLLSTVTEVKSRSLTHPMGLALAKDGSILIVNTHAHNIQKLSHDDAGI